MTELLLIRHGETAWNAERRLQGHIDIPLNEEGQRQARALAAALADEGIGQLVSSDLRRAAQTAGAVAERGGHDIQTDAALRERCYGIFEGLTYDEIAATHPELYRQWQARDPDFAMPGGESYRRFYARTIGALSQWAARHAGKKLAVVAHGGVLDCAYRAATGMAVEAPRNFTIHNASINRFRIENGKLSLLSWGETAHLQQALDEL